MNIFTQVLHPELLGKATPEDEHLTFAVKANIACGYLASACTPSLRDNTPLGYSPVVRALEDAGHKNIAIANMQELALGITSENPAFGDVDNPRKPGYIPGGSSGGSAAAVAMNSVTFSLGTDTAGSMRVPAALCGVVGYRPTTGLYDRAGVLPLSSTTDTIGIFAQQVTTVQRVHKAIVDKTASSIYVPETQSLEGVRIGLPRSYYYSIVDDEVLRVTESALEALRKKGVKFIDESQARFSLDEKTYSGYHSLISYEMSGLIPKYLKENYPSVSFEQLCEGIATPGVRERIERAKKATLSSYEQSKASVDDVRKIFDAYFSDNKLDAFICPTTILPACKRPAPEKIKVPIRNTKELREYSLHQAYVHNTLPQVLAAVPCVSIPSGLTSEGLPVGLELVAPRGQDNKLLDLAASVQQVLPALPQLSFEDFRDKL